MDSKGVMESSAETRSEAIADLRAKPQAPNATNAEGFCDDFGSFQGGGEGSLLKANDRADTAESAKSTQKPTHIQAILEELKQGYKYFGIDTCATCSMCSLSCPLEIDSGKIASKLSPATKGTFSRFVATQSAKHFSTTLSLAKGGLRIANFSSNMLGKNTLSNLSKKLKFLPYIPHSLPRANAYKLESKDSNAQSQVAIIYFSTCINRSFAPQSSLKDTRALQEVFESLCKKANVSVVYPQNLSNLCCGKAYKDYPQSAEAKRKEVYKALESSVKELQSKGVKQIHIVCDHSACSYELKNGLKELDSTLTILDMPECIESTLLPRLHITPLDEDIALYAMCATKKGKWDKSLESIAKTCTSGEVIIHSKTQCCGFAGNKGFICSELNASALRELSEFYKAKKLRLGFSSSSTCEIGLNDKTNIIWQNLIYLVDRVSKSKNM